MATWPDGHNFFNGRVAKLEIDRIMVPKFFLALVLQTKLASEEIVETF